MRIRHELVAAAAFLSCSLGAAFAVAKDAASARPLPVAHVHFEQNATDGDVEVVIKAKGGDDGLAKLTVVSPDGRTVLDFEAPDDSTLGMRHFDCESPEPGDVNKLKAAYPEGVYKFVAATAAGETFRGTATLSHALPATAEFISPPEDAEGVSVQNLKVAWTPVRGVSAYLLEIEQDDLDVNLSVKLPASATTFAVPRGFLLPDTEYALGIGTMTPNGNVSFVETSFTTAKGK